MDLPIASVGDRFVAVLIDGFVLLLTLLVLLVAYQMIDDVWMKSLIVVAVFGAQNFYFIVAEARGGGTTIGKRRVGVRVVDARGGPLTFDAVVVRNVMRIIEFQLPMIAFLAPSTLLPHAPIWAQWAGVMWLLALAGMPFFNSQRMRIGDLVAGTCVVQSPRAVLLPDMARVRKGRASATKPKPAATYSFTRDQLSVYGVYELQVLEDVLRIDDPMTGKRDAQRAVADRIRRKIRWKGRIPPTNVELFLREYYAALRAHLEQRMLLGRKKVDKHSDEEETE
jgi:uncharacterized RDD family membrane protein YckC